MRTNDDAIELFSVKQPVTEMDLARADRELGFRIPDELRAFLLAHNGGRPIRDAFTCSSVNAFFAIDHPTCESLDLVNVYLQMRGRVPSQLLPFANDPGGNLICLGIEGPARGKVYFWDHESEPAVGPDEDNDPSEWPDGVDPWIDDRDFWSAVTLVADSFEAFLAGLYEVEDDDDDEDTAREI